MGGSSKLISYLSNDVKEERQRELKRYPNRILRLFRHLMNEHGFTMAQSQAVIR